MQLSEEKQTKIICTNFYRNTINDDDSQIACVQTPPPLKKGRGHLVTKCCIYNQFSVAFILHSIKAYFFTCSYFRILYSVLHLKDSSTSMRAKLDDLNSIHTLVQLNISERLHSSNKKLSFSDHVTGFPATMTQ